MMRKDVKHIKGIGFDDSTNTIIKKIQVQQNVSYAHAVRILIRIGWDTLGIQPDILEAYKDQHYGYELIGGCHD